jgi:hypothetical protein
MDLSELLEEYNTSNSKSTFKNFIYKRNLEINLEVLNDLELNEEDTYNFLSKLKEYKYIDEVDDLKYGSFIRWIPLTDPENLPLHHSGMICEVRFTDDGTIIICKNFMHRHYSIKMDECLIFQKFSNDEKMMIELIDKGI